MPNIGLVLSGGFAKGAYQVGVLKALRQFFTPDEFAYISASSIGTLNAYCFVQNKLDEAERVWRNQKFAGIRSFTHAYARSDYVPNAIRDVTKMFSAYKPDLYTTLLNINTRSLNYVNLKEIDPKIIWGYLQASVSLPMVSRIVDINGTKYCDGAFVDNIPTKPLLDKPLDYAIVIHFDRSSYIFENNYFDNKLIKMNFLDNKIIGNSLSFDEESIAYMIKTGYDESMTMFEMYFKNGIHDIEYICDKIRFINNLRGKQPFRLTGDVVVSNLNRVLKKVVKSKI